MTVLRPQRWRQAGWLRVLAAVVVVLSLVTYLNIVSHRRGVAENQTAAHLQNLALLLNEESALQWKTLADRSAPVRVAREVGAIRGRERRILLDLGEALDRGAYGQLKQMVDDYHIVLDRELGLLAVDRTDAAVALEWSRTDPLFKSLSQRISALSDASLARARRSSAAADYILVAAMLLAALCIGALLRRFEHAHRAAVRASTELLKQERNALRLANENAAVIRRQAEHDALTGLPNRLLFTQRVEETLRNDGEPAVVFLDLDDFKRINDSLGHAAGDALLVEVADRLLAAVRPNETAARLGGDEFAVLVEDGGAAMAVRLAERVIESLREPLNAGGTQVLTQGSVGIAVTDRHGSPADLLRNADVAMYAAKSRGRAQFAVFEESMHDPLRARVGLEVDLRRALETDQLHLEYQPVVELDSGHLVGAESLVRWQHPTHGALSPAVFLPIAEASGLILPLGRWVLREACRRAAQWIDERPGAPFVISVNLSAHQLHHPGIVDEARAALEDSGLAPQALMLEVTESAIVHNHEAVGARLARLRALGIGVALDDFGTGYSSLTHLQRFPVDQIKVDRSFVAKGDKLGEAVLRLGQALGLQTVAEGIETREQAERMRRFGCELGQGYWFAKPVPLTEMRRLLQLPGPYVAWDTVPEAEPVNIERPGPGRSRPSMTGVA